ncbi:MAG: Uma2 family endonuclease [Stenomitos rutilans HA7619-LM2]|jgi:Uma2 family endonuclease|nr:Uma2 family endonuclease [Stenomitos rutilans HA7619-LM2]
MAPQLLSSSIDEQSLPEQRVVLQGVSWQQYEILLATLGDDFPALRLSYLEGALEIMTTSPLHEELKKMIGMLMEAYFQETRTRFHAIGSATFRKVAKQRGLEPDECYCLGQKKEFPDLAIEVVLSSGMVDKLEIYRGLEVTEVWVWENGRFAIYHLRAEVYELVAVSELLPDCNVELLARYVKPEEQFDAVMAFREALKARSQK